MFSKLEILEIAIRLEENGEKRYATAAREIRHPALRNICDWMATEEQKHAKFFSDLKNNLEDRGDDHLIHEMSSALVNDYIGNQTFS
ncbi:MAG: ferritin family protein, partial [Thermodesulfobacteriota bacterium]